MNMKIIFIILSVAALIAIIFIWHIIAENKRSKFYYGVEIGSKWKTKLMYGFNDQYAPWDRETIWVTIEDKAEGEWFKLKVYNKLKSGWSIDDIITIDLKTLMRNWERVVNDEKADESIMWEYEDEVFTQAKELLH